MLVGVKEQLMGIPCSKKPSCQRIHPILDGKPISLTYRCPCRYFESHVAKSQLKHLKILTVPGCPLQVIARLKNSSKQICIDSKLKWIQEYLEKYFQK
ncbi:stromal cell-derived factor 1 isoform X2 [Pituophis catenifer annectens]